MSILIRKNAWNNNGTFNNLDLLWYAKAVGKMQAEPLNSVTSWWFFAAMHGQYLTNDVNTGTPPPTGNPNWTDILPPPVIPTVPLPNKRSMDMYWDQCQHGTWYFLPWHRGYLYALENVLRNIIVNMGGPEDWALPYWNYFGPGDEYKIPPVFTQRTLPNGSPNPLYVSARYGPNNDGVIVIPISSWGINENCQGDTIFTGSQPDYYGGEQTGFEHSGYDDRGSIEDNPHNIVHVAIGGQNTSGVGGLMSIPNTAALDPIFYLHHCNIDRMWSEWNNTNTNPTDAAWLSGPMANGDRKFFMPKPDQTPWQYTPADVNDISQLNYQYEKPASIKKPLALLNKRSLRLRNFGLNLDEIKSFSNMSFKTDSELVGANAKPIILDAAGARTIVKLDQSGWKNITKSLTNIFDNRFAEGLKAKNLPDNVYLQLEGIKGKEDSIVCSISVNNHYAGHISLFGLRSASTEGSHHGGLGLTLRLDISKIVDDMHKEDNIDINSLDILIQPVNTVAQGNELTIQRISVYRKGQI